MSDKSINSLEEKKYMITFILGMFIGTFITLVMIALLTAGKVADVEKENYRLRNRVNDQAKRLFSSWQNWKEEKQRAQLLEKANEELEAEKNELVKKLNPDPVEEDHIPSSMYLSRM